MKEWIKQHPWQMEIVPFLSFVFALVVPLIYRQQSIPLMHGQHGLSQAQTWWGWYAFGVLVFVASFVGHVYCNHLTIRFHLDTRHDWHLSAMIAFMGLISNVFMLHFRVPSWVAAVWAVLLICSLLVQSWLRKIIPQAPRVGMPSADLAAMPGHQGHYEDVARPGEPFYYRESLRRHFPMNLLPKSTAIRLRLASWLGGAALLVVVWWTSKNWWDMAWPILLFAAWELWDRFQGTYFMTTPQRIKARIDTGKLINVRMSDVCRCEIVQAMPRSDEHFLMDIDVEGIMNTARSNSKKVLEEHPYLLNIGRLLEVETGDGKTHKFRLRDPDKACKLINAALESRTDG